MHCSGLVWSALLVAVLMQGRNVQAEEFRALESGNFTVNTAHKQIDSDLDGLPDAWELAHGLKLFAYDSTADLDGDGRTNLQEYNAGSDPEVDDWPHSDVPASTPSIVDTGAYWDGYSIDSDSDGMPDWWEAKYGLSITTRDADGNLDQDGLANGVEYTAGLNPTIFDTVFFADGKTGLFVLDTGGWWTDTDADGLPNWWERTFAGNTLSMLAGVDLDGDGQSNLREYAAGVNPLDSQSSFRIIRYWAREGPNGSEFAIQWESKARRIYRVFATQDLNDWQPEPVAEIVGDGFVKTHAYPSVGTKIFLRIDVRIVQP